MGLTFKLHSLNRGHKAKKRASSGFLLRRRRLLMKEVVLNAPTSHLEGPGESGFQKMEIHFESHQAEQTGVPVITVCPENRLVWAAQRTGQNHPEIGQLRVPDAERATRLPSSSEDTLTSVSREKTRVTHIPMFWANISS